MNKIRNYLVFSKYYCVKRYIITTWFAIVCYCDRL